MEIYQILHQIIYSKSLLFKQAQRNQIFKQFCQMEKKQIQEAKQLSKRAQDFEKQGNFQYARKCYTKIIMILKQLLKNTNQPSTAKTLQQKIKKYVEQSKRVSEMQTNRNSLNNASKIGLGFPISITPNQSSNIRGTYGFGFPNQASKQQKTLKKDINQIQKNNSQDKKVNNNINNLSKKRLPPNFKIDDDVQGMIVRNIKLTFQDIVGMQQVKDIIEESVIRPRKRPDLFTGIRAPPRGILFYGPPGNGKTYFAKALANEAKCTFFSVSASAIMNKYVGQSQKMLKKLFCTAQQLAPSIIFIDQIDSLLTARSEKQNESARRVKTQFLVLMDGMMSAKQGDVLLVGATNLPKQLDLAVLRRFNKLIYIGLPDVQARQGIVLQNLKDIPYDLSKKDMVLLTNKYLEGYTASEVKDLVKQVSMLPIRDIKKSEFEQIKAEKIRKVTLKDFQQVLSKKKPLLSKQDLAKYKEIQ